LLIDEKNLVNHINPLNLVQKFRDEPNQMNLMKWLIDNPVYHFNPLNPVQNL